MLSFEALFRSPSKARDKLLARVFGIFSEDVVRIWTGCDQAAYRNLGRPTVSGQGSTRGYTLDFALQSRHKQQTFVAELKCELEYRNYRYLRLTDVRQLEHHTKPAFRVLLEAASDPTSVRVKISSKPVCINGAILVWGDASDEGIRHVIRDYGFADILTISSMIQDLNRWRPSAWEAFVRDRRQWTNELFDGLSTLTGA